MLRIFPFEQTIKCQGCGHPLLSSYRNLSLNGNSKKGTRVCLRRFSCFDPAMAAACYKGRVWFDSRFRTGYATPDSTEVYTAKVVSQLPFLQAWLQWNGVEDSTFIRFYS